MARDPSAALRLRPRRHADSRDHPTRASQRRRRPFTRRARRPPHRRRPHRHTHGPLVAHRVVSLTGHLHVRAHCLRGITATEELYSALCAFWLLSVVFEAVRVSVFARQRNPGVMQYPTSDKVRRARTLAARRSRAAAHRRRRHAGCLCDPPRLRGRGAPQRAAGPTAGRGGRHDVARLVPLAPYR